MSFLVNHLVSLWHSLWQSLGLSNKSGSVLLLGLDNAGKTTLLHRLASEGEIRSFPPTDRPRQDSFRFGQVHFKAWDMGGHEAVRHLWDDYMPEISAILFLIDSTDSDRLEEAAYELDALIDTLHRNCASTSSGDAMVSVSNGGPTIHQGGGEREEIYNINGDDSANVTNNSSISIPIAILINKCDLPDSMTTEHILDKLEFIHLQKAYPNDLLQVFRISVLTGEGYPDAFRWISSFL